MTHFRRDECRHFQPDPIGAGGIGTCAVDAELRLGEIPMYPNAKRQCGRWLPNFRPADADREYTLELKPEPGH